jgi:hypothetical protein
MTFEEYNQRMDALIKDLPGAHANLLIGVANTALAMVKKRIQTSGVDANGNKFKSYSDWYQKYKTEKGKNKGFTDFSFTNRMWSNIQLIKDKSTDQTAIITAQDKGSKGGSFSVPVKAHKRKGKQIAATTKTVYAPSNYEKLEKNTKSFGEILNLSKQEIEDIRSDYDAGILEIFRDHGL